jgi:hypothetical protein
MQVGALTPSTVVADLAAAAARADATDAAARPAAATDGATTAAAPADAVPAADAAPVRAGLTNWDPHVNGQVADAQQALEFLDQAASQLQGLKAALSGKLAGQAVGDQRLAASLRQFAQTWSRRAQATGGSLGPQLDYSSPAPAVQRFTVRGLSLGNLQSGSSETLTLSVAGARGPMSVQIDPGMSGDEIVQRFNQALAPANIGVDVDQDGNLRFSVAEDAWPRVRDTLSIRGGGQRFPSGQPVRPKTDAEPPAVQPDTWSAGETERLRRTLAQVTQALDRVRQAQQSINQALAAATACIGNANNAAAIPAIAYAQDFAAAISQPGFAAFTPVTAALSGISRDRVLSLLALSQG